MNYSAVLFDLDGTLLNSLEGIARAMNAVPRNWQPPAPGKYFTIPAMSLLFFHKNIGALIARKKSKEKGKRRSN
jgi:phosphoglycolate phosphatase-like HAD superfamily hydrolase